MIKLPKFSVQVKKDLAKKYQLTLPGVDFKIKAAKDIEFIKDALEMEKLFRASQDNERFELQKLAEDLIKDDEEIISNAYQNNDRIGMPIY